VEQETACFDLEMETAEGEETMSKHLPECLHYFPDGTPGNPCQVCDALRACEEQTRNQVISEVVEVIMALDSIEDEANGYSYPDRTTQEIVNAIRELGEVK